jgi:C-terminal processing protease CtpA/Prc
MPEKVASAQRGAAQPNGSTANALGMEFVALDPQLRQELHVPKEVNGVVVGQVASDSPAGELGIQAGDVIVSVDQNDTPRCRRSVKGGGRARQRAVAAQPPWDKPIRRLVGRE